VSGVTNPLSYRESGYFLAGVDAPQILGRLPVIVCGLTQSILLLFGYVNRARLGFLNNLPHLLAIICQTRLAII
jgi:hypothetical protein